MRIDEQLRLKQIDIQDFNELTPGWTKIAAQEILEHKRLLYSIRCYLSITGTNLFGVPMLSIDEYNSLKCSFQEKENFLSMGENSFATMTALSQEEVWLLLNVTSDRHNTEGIFKKIISRIIDNYYHNIEYAKKENMINTIITKCFFTVQ